jgi:hypothetical protein
VRLQASGHYGPKGDTQLRYSGLPFVVFGLD